MTEAFKEKYPEYYDDVVTLAAQNGVTVAHVVNLLEEEIERQNPKPREMVNPNDYIIHTLVIKEPEYSPYKPKPPKMKCGHCARPFRTEDAMKRHLLRNHNADR